MSYSLAFQKTDTLAATMAAGATLATLTSGNFGSPSGTQILVIDYDVPSKAAAFKCTIAGTAVTAMVRINGPDVEHVTGSKVTMSFVPEHYDYVKTPVGAILQFAGSLAPSGWLLCNGVAVSRTTYAGLFAVLSTTYGIGDGSTTFNLPNLLGRVPVGRDAGQTEFDVLGETGGAKTHILTTTEMPAHTHTQDAHSHGAGSYDVYATTGQFLRAKNLSATGGGTTYGVWSNGTEDGDAYIIGTSAGATATNQNAGSGAAHNNLPPYLVLNYIIKF